MTKSRFLIGVALVLLILGVALFTFSNRKTGQIISAMVNRDCAPWDGSAFMVQIPWDDGEAIHISIWQAPDIKFPKTFSFPDDMGQVGTVNLIRASGTSDVLAGSVWFRNVGEGRPIEGRFNLTSVSGAEFVGEFHAEWGNLMMFCG